MITVADMMRKFRREYSEQLKWVREINELWPSEPYKTSVVTQAINGPVRIRFRGPAEIPEGPVRVRFRGSKKTEVK